MKSKSIEEIRQMEDLTDWQRLSKGRDYEGEDEDDFDVDWGSAVLVIPEPKKPISLRLDQDVLDYFKAQGKGYQTRINAVLRSYMETQQKPR